MSEPRLRTVRVDPYATSDLAREHHLTGTDAWVLHLMAIQAEYRSGEWSGTLTDLASATRVTRKTAGLVVKKLVRLGLIEEVERFRGGAEGRVLIVVRDQIVVRPRRSQSESYDANSAPAERDGFASGSRPVRDRFGSYSANDQGEEGVREVQRQRGSEEVPEGARCATCWQLIEGHSFGDHEPRFAEAAQ